MKKFYTFLVALFALIGVAQAQTITFDATVDKGNNTTASGADKVEKDGITISTTSGGLGTGQQYRFAKSSVTTITSTVGNIQKIVFTCAASGTSKYGPGCFDAQVGYTYDGTIGTWTGDALSVTFTAGTDQVRATKIEITIKNSDPNYVAAPKITPATGTYYEAQEVTIEKEDGTRVFYTLDGSEPTASSTAYTEPFTVEATTTVKAIAFKGENKSEIAESVITIAELPAKTIAEVLAAGAGEGKVSATVVAAASTGVLLQDATGYIFVYTGGEPEVTVGDVVTVSGPTSEYGGRIQFTEKASVTKTGTAEVTYPDPAALDATAFDALVGNIEVKYVTANATITSVGTYNNFKITSAKNTGSIIAPADVLSSLTKDAVVKITGYFIYVTGTSTKYGTIIATKVELPDIEYTEYNALAAIKAAATDAEAYAQLNLTDMLVSYVNGQSVYLFDGTDGMLVYGTNKGIKTGDKISGNVKGKLYKRYGNTQLAVTAYDVTVSSSDNAVEPQVISPAAFNANGAAYENELITLKGLVPNAEALADKLITFSYEDDEEEEKYTFTVRDNFGVLGTMEFNKNAAYNVTGFVAVYTKDGATTIQIYPREKADIDDGVVYEFTGDGTLEKPYTVKDVQNMNSEHASEGVWVKAYIVGYINGSPLNATTATFSAQAPEGGEVLASNILVADAADANTLAAIIPVALPNNADARNDLNLKDNAGKLGTQVWLKGNITTYMGVMGLKEVKVYSLDGVNIVDGVAGVEAAPVNQAVYTLDGIQMKAPNKPGLYIIGGKAVIK